MEIDRRKRQRWTLLGSVSSLAAVIVSHYLHGSLSTISAIAFAVTCVISTYFTFRDGPGPFQAHDSVTR